jgi:hypothetical protein
MSRAEARMYARFALGLRRFLNKTLTLEEARSVVCRRLEQRNENFVRIVDRAVYRNPRSPYLVLLKQAGCLRVKRMEPHWTARGKLMPLYSQKWTGNKRP